jgi:hypothetical protein
VKAVRDGRVLESRVRESLARLRRVCPEEPLIKDDEVARRSWLEELQYGSTAVPEPDGPALADEIARRALTAVRGAAPTSPVDLLVVVSGDPGEAWGDLVAETHRISPSTRLLPVATDSPDERLATLLSSVEAASRAGERVGVALFSKVLAWKGGAGAGMPAREAKFADDICRRASTAAGGKGAIAIACGSPWLLEHARAASFTACAFSDEPSSQRAVAAAFLAKAGFPGRAPVNLDALSRERA